jgi:predicted protein tyrosine phosphatase
MADELYEDASDKFNYSHSNEHPDPDKDKNPYSEIGIIIEESQSHYLIAIKNIAELAKNVRIWKGVLKDDNGIVSNRRKDENKINEIYEAMKNKSLASSIISASEFKSRDGLSTRVLCWDGQHRYWALRKYYKHIKNNYSGNIYLIVYRCDTRRQMVERFKNINKGTPAQAQYSSNIIKNTVDAVTGCILKKYSTLNKSSGNPNKPNYNINNVHTDLTNMLESLDKDYINTNLIHTCIAMIDIINMEIKDIYENKYAHKIKDKWLINAEAVDCFLFLEYDFIDMLKNKIINN